MKIVILNGSPKGPHSISLHTCLFLKKHFPEHEWEVLHVGQRIRSIEADPESAMAALERADMLMMCYPVYTFLVPSQMHRFIELMKEQGVQLAGKKAVQICTSKHFYDVTAMRFVEDNLADMGVELVDSLSADMEDLPTEKGQMQAINWWRLVEWKLAGQPMVAHTEKRVVVVTDLAPEDEELRDMIARFRAALPYESDVFNIREFPFQGGCISCFRCSSKGKCFYKDGFDTYLREEIQKKHDSIVYAFRIKDHSMGSLFKQYDDRQFCNGHRTVTMGMPFAYLIAGDYSKEENLQLMLRARAEVGGNYLAGIALSDSADSVGQTAAALVWALENAFTKPATFYGVGGMKIFRDLIFEMRGMMRADHKFFKSHGQYDFPHNHKTKSWMMYLVGWMMNSDKMRKKMGNKLNDGMIAPYKKVVEE